MTLSGAGIIKRDKILTGFLLALLVFAALVRFCIITTNEINWDEFFYLSQIYSYKSGALYGVFQTIHVHLFGWLASVSGNEASQIIAARSVMLALQLASGYFLYAIGKVYFSKPAALFTALSYLSFSFILWQGTSFRTDPIATALLTGSLYLFVCHRRTTLTATGAGLMIGLAAMVTIKSVLYVPTLGIILLASLATAQDKRGPFLHALASGLIAALCLGGLYLWHQSTLPTLPADATKDMLAGSYNKTISLDVLFPSRYYLIHSLPGNIAFWFFMLCGLGAAGVIAVCGIKQKDSDKLWRGVSILAMGLPLLTLIFYRNGFPYYYAFMLAPVSVLCGAGWHFLAEKKRKSLSLLLYAGLVFCCGNLVFHGVVRPLTHPLSSQRQTIATVHKLFPAPTAYFDRCGIISSYPRAGFFMTTWGLEKYRANDIPVLKAEIEDKKPKFIIADIAQLDFAHQSFAEDADAAHQLLDPDKKALQENYIPFWGPLYIAGKEFRLSRQLLLKYFHIIIAGPYKIRSAEPVRIDGHIYQPGETVTLNAGKHNISGSGTVRLTWGKTIEPPAIAPPEKPLFTGF